MHNIGLNKILEIILISYEILEIKFFEKSHIQNDR